MAEEAAASTDVLARKVIAEEAAAVDGDAAVAPAAAVVAGTEDVNVPEAERPAVGGLDPRTELAYCGKANVVACDWDRLVPREIASAYAALKGTVVGRTEAPPPDDDSQLYCDGRAVDDKYESTAEGMRP